MMSDATTLMVDYSNYRGERAWRRIRPSYLHFANSPYHPHTQWLLHALDLEKEVERDFALKDIHRMLPFAEFNLQQATKPVSKIEEPLSCHQSCAKACAQQGTYNPTCSAYPERRCADTTKLLFPMKVEKSLEDCYCFENHCRGGETLNGRLANGLLCKKEKTK